MCWFLSIKDFDDNKNNELTIILSFPLWISRKLSRKFSRRFGRRKIDYDKCENKKAERKSESAILTISWRKTHTQKVYQKVYNIEILYSEGNSEGTWTTQDQMFFNHDSVFEDLAPNVEYKLGIILNVFHKVGLNPQGSF